MASRKTLNAKNLEALGVARLAGLLIEVSAGDAAIKRRLRLELAGPAEVGREIGKRLTSIARARSFIDWQKRKAFVADLETQRRRRRLTRESGHQIADSQPRCAQCVRVGRREARG